MNLENDSGTSNAAKHVVVLSHSTEAAACISLGLQGRFAVCHFTSIEQVLTARLLPRCIAAFVDCVMPTPIFRAIRGSGRASRVRVIGIRDERPSNRPLELLAQHLIAAYIKVPVTLSVVDALISEMPVKGQSGELPARATGARNY